MSERRSRVLCETFVSWLYDESCCVIVVNSF